jgi:hypothetical protein
MPKGPTARAGKNLPAHASLARSGPNEACAVLLIRWVRRRDPLREGLEGTAGPGRLGTYEGWFAG